MDFWKYRHLNIDQLISTSAKLTHGCSHWLNNHRNNRLLFVAYLFGFVFIIISISERFQVELRSTWIRYYIQFLQQSQKFDLVTKLVSLIYVHLQSWCSQNRLCKVCDPSSVSAFWKTSHIFSYSDLVKSVTNRKLNNTVIWKLKCCFVFFSCVFRSEFSWRHSRKDFFKIFLKSSPKFSYVCLHHPRHQVKIPIYTPSKWHCQMRDRMAFPVYQRILPEYSQILKVA